MEIALIFNFFCSKEEINSTIFGVSKIYGSFGNHVRFIDSLLFRAVEKPLTEHSQ